MPDINQKLLAWSVHIFTSLGLILGFLAIVAIDQKQWEIAFLFLLVCLIIDGLDGSLARKYNIDEILPDVNGKQIDYVIDFVTYTIVPCFFFYKAEMATNPLIIPSVIAILLSSLFYYGKQNMVVEGEYFQGFPVLWNIVVFYLYFIIGNIEYLNFIAVIIFSILHFIPLKYAYPSRSTRFFWSHLTVSFLGFLSAAIFLLSPSDLLIIKIFLGFIPIYFFGFVAYDSLSTKKSE